MKHFLDRSEMKISSVKCLWRRTLLHAVWFWGSRKHSPWFSSWGTGWLELLLVSAMSAILNSHTMVADESNGCTCKCDDNNQTINYNHEFNAPQAERSEVLRDFSYRSRWEQGRWVHSSLEPFPQGYAEVLSGTTRPTDLQKIQEIIKAVIISSLALRPFVVLPYFTVSL